MTKLTNLILILACGLAAAAFSLEKPVRSSRFSTSIAIRQSKNGRNFAEKTFPFSFALSSEGARSEVVATSTSSSNSGSVLGTIWNENTKLFVYLAVWYLGNIYYNIYNKEACIALGKSVSGRSNLHWALSAFQLMVGVLFVVPLWITGLRKAPEMTAENWKELSPVGVWAALSHAFSVLALGAGAVSFGQIVKAGEPVFAAATNALLLKDIDHPLVYAALIPIIGGVGLASLKELSFTWTALLAASAANQAAAFKNVVSKGVMNKPWAKSLGPQNTYAVVTILALIATLPLVLLFDLKDFKIVYDMVVKTGKTQDVLKFSILSGLAFYLYNEASFLALEKLNPVTHSVANTFKRVIIIVASCVVFQTPMTLLGGVGSGVAVLGTLLYSLAKKKYSKKGGGH
ncbi:hypothetical protein EON64_01255 [archaeon]|nr:MAG: hypothetical protein EON64_01255 [archaeon]